MKRAEEEKERVALERKSRSVERAVSAQSQQKASSSQRPESDRQSSAERKYSKERGPSPLEQQKQAQRSQSTGERSHRSRSRDSAKSSGSYPSPLADPATRYHQQVTQELQQYKGPLEFFRGGATSMASMSCGPGWESGRGWGGWRPGRGRGQSPGGFPVWRGGRPFQGRSPSPRRERGNWGRGYQRYWQNRTRGYARGPPKGSRGRGRGQEPTYGESGEYTQGELGEEEEEEITPTTTPTPSPPSSGRPEASKRTQNRAAAKQRRNRERILVPVAEGGGEEVEGEEEGEREAPIPVTPAQIRAQGLNIDPRHRMHLVTTSFVKEKVKVMVKNAKLEQFKDITEVERLKQDEKFNDLSKMMKELIEAEKSRQARAERRRVRRKLKKGKDPGGPSSSESDSDEEDDDEDHEGQSGTGEEEDDDEGEGDQSTEKKDEEGKEDEHMEEEQDKEKQDDEKMDDKEKPEDQPPPDGGDGVTPTEAPDQPFQQHEQLLAEKYTGAEADQQARAVVEGHVHAGGSSCIFGPQSEQESDAAAKRERREARPAHRPRGGAAAKQWSQTNVPEQEQAERDRLAQEHQGLSPWDQEGEVSQLSDKPPSPPATTVPV
ncbi:MAG: hypothetical protein GY821_15105, partial [Gammaproteobacteria bacterium]|nr:hypothetical protein [Gammaproteobacteria bacterium]